MSAVKHIGTTRVPARRARLRRGGLLLLWSLAWSALALAMLTSYQPLLQTTRRAMDRSFTQRATTRNLAEAAANEAFWYAQYGLLDVVANPTDSAYFCDAPWTASCIDKGAPLVDFDNNGQIRVADISAALTFPFHGSHGWNPETSGQGYDAQGQAAQPVKTGSLTAADGGGVIGHYWMQAQLLWLPQPRIVAKACVPQGCNPSTGTGATQRSTTRVVLERVDPQFLYATFGKDRLILGNHVQMDSYDSGETVGYGEPLPGGGNNISQLVRIGTNGSGSSPEFQIQGTDVLVQGKLVVSPNTTDSVPVGSVLQDFLPGQTDPIEQQDQVLPNVIVPNSLSTLAVTTVPTAGWSGTFTYNSSGDFKCTGTCTCTTAVRIKSLYVLGTLNMGAGCDILVDRCADGTCSTVPYTIVPGGAALDTDGSGKLQKTSASDTTQVFIRDSKFNLDGGGMTWLWSIPTQDRDTPKLQLFATCSSPPCNNSTASSLAQHQPFYGVVYIQDGNLAVQRASENTMSYNATYHGAFVSGKVLEVQTTGEDYTAFIHWDEQAGTVPLDGSDTQYQAGEKYYRILSWQTE